MPSPEALEAPQLQKMNLKDIHFLSEVFGNVLDFCDGILAEGDAAVTYKMLRELALESLGDLAGLRENTEQIISGITRLNIGMDLKICIARNRFDEWINNNLRPT
ncbi:hypothetical protein EJ06DRAFT_552046 [Trichodelitschia bisporula]|uniref:Uncharacterized protein n=1 Tax=Trichodelitschia bisporula TaxID=703511 RepID=A0A6G1HJB0_9PEZI|nr:hypothetical protein EJ06DRAFT_552046 [Trichodelitschia bisporula]